VTKQERSWILYDVANSAYSVAITAAVFPIFFKSVAAAGMAGFDSTALWGYANSLSEIVIAVLAPLLGTLGDQRNAKKRLFFGFFAMGVVSVFAFTLIGEGQWLRALLLYGASAIAWAGANIFYDSFLTDVTGPERMDWVSSAGFAYGYVGSTIPFIAGMAIIMAHKQLGFESSVPAVRIAFVITAAWWGVITIPLLRNVQQVHFVPPAPHPLRASFGRLAETFRDIRRYRNAFLFLLAYFFYIDGVDTIIRMATAFGTDIGIDSSTLLVILLVIQFVAFPFALLYGRLARATSTRFMLFVGIGVYIVIVITAFFLPLLPTSQLRLTMFWVLSLLVATSQGGIQALSRSFYGKLIPAERSAEFFGFYNIFGKFAAIMGPFLMGIFSQITRSTNTGVLSLILLFIVGAVLLTRVKEER
jgi:MFS transporter, UMF1 family